MVSQHYLNYNSTYNSATPPSVNFQTANLIDTNSMSTSGGHSKILSYSSNHITLKLKAIQSISLQVKKIFFKFYTERLTPNGVTSVSITGIIFPFNLVSSGTHDRHFFATYEANNFSTFFNWNTNE